MVVVSSFFFGFLWLIVSRNFVHIAFHLLAIVRHLPDCVLPLAVLVGPVLSFVLVDPLLCTGV